MAHKSVDWLLMLRDSYRYLWDGFGYLDILSKARRRGAAQNPEGRRIAARRGFAGGGFLTISLENKNDFGILVDVLLHLKGDGRAQRGFLCI